MISPDGDPRQAADARIEAGERSYVGELAAGRRRLVGAALGFGFGGNLDRFLLTLFAPHLIATFGWSRSQFATIGATVAASILLVPLVGRLADIWGVRKVALVGIVAAPCIDVALASMTGDFATFFLICLVQTSLVGITTTTVVYGRVIADAFHRSRGIALSICASATPLVGALVVAPFAYAIQTFGWRSAYLLLGATTATLGLLALHLIGPTPVDPARRATAAGTGRRSFGSDLRSVAADRNFRFIAIASFLCNTTLMVQGSQLQLILLDQRLTVTTATSLVALYSAGIVAGRLLCGVALDRFPTPLVAMLALGLPGIGLILLASGIAGAPGAAIAVLLIGLSTGAETDVLAYFAMTYFTRDRYGLVFGLFGSVSALSGALGSLALGLLLRIEDSYTTFLIVTGTITLVGSLFFLPLKWREAARAR